VREFSEIAPGVFLTGEVPRVTDFEKGDARMSVKAGGNWKTDPFLDDYTLALKTPEGLVVVLGCAHAGLINIVRHLVEKTGEDRIAAILGGTHLGFYSEELLDATARELEPYGVKVLAVSHCTGQKAAAYLASVYGPRFAFGHVGYSISNA
jgi:7,8-dihydropterin-6-yl-methyl-4-(beta-D-ribofuranosyl)aminobenzene 5'-phosphate synthase